MKIYVNNLAAFYSYECRPDDAMDIVKRELAAGTANTIEELTISSTPLYATTPDGKKKQDEETKKLMKFFDE